ncbi:hypothetical protein IFR05_017598, partial [Cadophora sp. M221]
ELTSLEHLELKRCEGTRSILLKAMLSGGLMLKKLTLVVTEKSDSYVAQFLAWLAQFTKLEELSLLLVGSHIVFPLSAVLLHAQALQRLVLDSRTEIQDPTTIIRYTIADLKQITKSCPLLWALRISLHLEAPSPEGTRRGPRRTDTLKVIKPACDLRILYLRG